MKSVLLACRFALIEAQRDALWLDLGPVTLRDLWQKPAADKWSNGQTLEHLRKMLRIYRLSAQASFLTFGPLARIRRHRPYVAEARNLYSSDQPPRRASRLVMPRQRWVPLRDLRDGLERETRRLRDLLADLDENVAGHLRVMDPGAGHPNLLQVLQMIHYHEAHHFEIIRTLIAASGNAPRGIHARFF